jgi:hypothetical protein
MNFINKIFKNETYKITDWHMVGLVFGATAFTIGGWELIKYLPMLLPYNAVYYPMEWFFYAITVVIGIGILAWASFAFTKFNKGGNRV